MSAIELEQTLRDFDRIATRVAECGDRQTWRFEWNSRQYLLYFYSRAGSLRRIFAGNPAQRQFFGLQMLQKLGIPSPRAVAQLAGFRIADRVGNAVIVEAIGDGTTLEQFLLDHELRAEPISNRRAIAQQVSSIVHRLGQAKLGHSNLTLQTFLIDNEKVYLVDGEHVHRRGLRIREVMRLGESAARFATRGEMRRAWEQLQPGAPMPRGSLFPLGTGRGDSFDRIASEGWRGTYTKRSQFARRGAVSSQLDISQDDWLRAWPPLLRQIEAGALPHLKRDASGEILETQIDLAGQTIPIIIKRPRNKFWYRYLLDAFRPSRASRTWKKTWKAIIRGLPTEWPMLLMERRVLGYVTDAVLVFERVEGTTLDRFDLGSLDDRDRETLFRRAGRSLRILERTGLAHIDPKSTNWIVVTDEKRGPVPVMIDLFGIRTMTFGREAFGIRRLLRAMRTHSQYTPADSLNLCLGFAPFSRIERERDAVPLGDPAEGR